MAPTKFMICVVVASLACVVVVVAKPHGDHPMGGLFAPFDALRQNLTEEQRQTVKGIFEDKTLTKQQLQDKLAAAFQGFGEPVNTAYQKAVADVKGKVAELGAKVDQTAAAMSPEAQAVIAQLKHIHEDQSLTPAAERDSVKAALEGASPQVKEEFKNAKAAFIKDHFGGESPIPASASVPAST